MHRLVPFLLLVFLLSPLAAFAQSSDTPPLPRPRPTLPQAAQDAPQPAPPPRSGVTTPNPGTAGPDSANTPQEAIARVLDGPPQKISLSARITEEGPVLPDGATWRIFSTKPDEEGNLPLVAKSHNAKAAFELPPGEYLVHLAYGDAQTTESLTVLNDAIDKTVVLDAGALRLHAQITGEVPIPADKLKFDILPGGSDVTDAEPVETGISPNETVQLNAGVYHIVSRFGKANAVVKADLRVEAGQLTDATLFHNAAQINFKLVSEEGGEAIADVEWSVKDDKGETVFARFGAFPSVVLAQGDYTVFAKQGGKVYNRDFSVSPGPTEEIEILTQVYKN